MLIAAAIFAVPLSLLLDRPWELAPSGTALFAVSTLGWLCTGVGYLLFFRIIARAGAGFVSLEQFSGAAVRRDLGRDRAQRRLEPRAFIALLADPRGVCRAAAVAAARETAAKAQLDKPSTSAIE